MAVSLYIFYINNFHPIYVIAFSFITTSGLGGSYIPGRRPAPARITDPAGSLYFERNERLRKESGFVWNGFAVALGGSDCCGVLRRAFAG